MASLSGVMETRLLPRFKTRGEDATPTSRRGLTDGCHHRHAQRRSPGGKARMQIGCDTETSSRQPTRDRDPA